MPTGAVVVIAVEVHPHVVVPHAVVIRQCLRSIDDSAMRRVAKASKLSRHARLENHLLEHATMMLLPGDFL
jgi:hypothetical protein